MKKFVAIHLRNGNFEYLYNFDSVSVDFEEGTVLFYCLNNNGRRYSTLYLSKNIYCFTVIDEEAQD